MNDFLNSASPDTLSTVIDNGAPAPGSADFVPDPIKVEPKEEAKPMSLDEAMKKAVADTKAQGEEPEKAEAKSKEEAKPKADPKPAPERGENGKFTAKPKAEPEPSGNPSAVDGGEVEQEAQQPARPSEGRDVNRAPAHFLPRAKEKWAGVDADVKGEVHRMMENYEKGLEEGREDREFRKSLRPYEEMAREKGVSINAALENYVRIDQELQVRPENALKHILSTIGLTPQQYAQHIMGQANQPNAPQVDRNTQALQQQVQALTQQIQQLTQGTQQDREAARLAEVERSVIAPFREAHPRYEELQGDIAFFLNSGKIPSNLPERQRLEVAYDMAERINPTGHYAESEPLNPAQNAQRPLNPAGSKSVKGSPSYGAEAPRKSAKLSLDESIKAAMAQRRF